VRRDPRRLVGPAQCPASFRPTDDNVARLREFVVRAPRPPQLRLLWEPRGPAWPDDLVAALCAELGLVHAADPFVRLSLTPDLRYYRLHGVTGSRHVYTDDELGRLAAVVGDGPAYVMFNNLARAEDARRSGSG
jgi:uncharacterized protein YecE (DUF72 family)